MNSLAGENAVEKPRLWSPPRLRLWILMLAVAIVAPPLAWRFNEVRARNELSNRSMETT